MRIISGDRIVRRILPGGVMKAAYLKLGLGLLLSLSTTTVRATEVDLADIVGHGNGLGTGAKGQGINPDDGAATTGSSSSNIGTSADNTDFYRPATGALLAN